MPLPTRDHDINFPCQKREALHAGFKVPMLTSADRDRLMNKDALSGLRHAGLDVPNAVTVHSSEELGDALCVVNCRQVCATDLRCRVSM